jgi:ribA/ribD-fused uncharacterized protein
MLNKQELLKNLSEGGQCSYTGFETGPLTMGYPAEIKNHWHVFKNAEQYFQYRKAAFFGDKETVEKILNTESIVELKKLGLNIKGFHKHAWDNIEDTLLYISNYLKFIQNPDLNKILENTCRDILVHLNPADLHRGSGLSVDDPRVDDPFQWPGENILGFTLMEIRDGGDLHNSEVDC